MGTTGLFFIPTVPILRIVQGGNNREACFVEPENYEFYLDLWKDVSRRYRVNVHSYCLMTNHIHFLATPETETGLSNTSKVVGSRYAQYMNKRYRRTGVLWERRHRSSLVQQPACVLSLYRDEPGARGDGFPARGVSLVELWSECMG